MKRLLLCGLALSLSASFYANAEDALYQFQGKAHTSKDLSPALQQAVYDVQHQAYESIQRIVDAQVFEDYAKVEAAKKKMTLEQYEEKTFKGKKVTEKDVTYLIFVFQIIICLITLVVFKDVLI